MISKIGLQMIVSLLVNLEWPKVKRWLSDLLVVFFYGRFTRLGLFYAEKLQICVQFCVVSHSYIISSI